MDAALVGEGRGPHKGLVVGRRQVGHFVGIMGERGQPGQFFRIQAGPVHLDLEDGDDYQQVGVAAPFAQAVQGALDLDGPLGHRGYRVGHRQAAVVVGVDAQRPAGDFLHLGHGGADLVGQGATEHVPDMQVPGLAEEGDDFGLGRKQLVEVFILGRRHAVPAGAAEGGHPGPGEVEFPDLPEEFLVLGVAAGPAALDEIEAELVQLAGELELVLEGEGDLLPLAAVPQGGVVNLDFLQGPGLFILFWHDGIVYPDQRRHVKAGRVFPGAGAAFFDNRTALLLC
ncbi:MAG: hypothetical protein BWY73_00421 [candidate division TA06 bacterium ADurb.Bin417]|uniref:Uncharacterized protein n=1 Tax=candidate division TA06 bacterium ADurb.Bin417 TaxID=1852828 RepID=A0A1V5MJ13_UNCT6|nr:MAG: hypothetical protein BWY73_00421 [candidate division TA06 bacterium ADurb.Bin417]